MNGSQPLSRIVMDLSVALRRHHWQMSTAESCTGGGIAAALTELPGSSEWFDRGWVTYSNAAKMEMLGVPAGLLERWGAVSGPVAQAMVEGALARSNAELALAVTGIAGPGGGSPEKPVGLVWFGWGRKGRPPRIASREFSGDRSAVRQAATIWSLQELLLHELMER